MTTTLPDDYFDISDSAVEALSPSQVQFSGQPDEYAISTTKPAPLPVSPHGNSRKRSSSSDNNPLSKLCIREPEYYYSLNAVEIQKLPTRERGHANRLISAKNLNEKRCAYVRLLELQNQKLNVELTNERAATAELRMKLEQANHAIAHLVVIVAAEQRKKEN